jgi:hypothetical protein
MQNEMMTTTVSVTTDTRRKLNIIKAKKDHSNLNQTIDYLIEFEYKNQKRKD